jgi:hypothetical protein
MDVDITEYTYTSKSIVPVIARGRDSADAYTVVLWVKQGVSMEAGKKPFEGEAFVLVRYGRGTLHFHTYSSRCTTYSKTDCVEKYIDPEHSFTLVGYSALEHNPPKP